MGWQGSPPVSVEKFFCEGVPAALLAGINDRLSVFLEPERSRRFQCLFILLFSIDPPLPNEPFDISVKPSLSAGRQAG
jgi:hypothetical protein